MANFVLSYGMRKSWVALLLLQTAAIGCASDGRLIDTADVALDFSLCQCGSIIFGADDEEISWETCKSENAARVEQALAALERGQTVSFTLPAGYDPELRLAWGVDPDGRDERAYPTFDEEGYYIEHAVEDVDLRVSRVETAVKSCDGQTELVSTLVVSWGETTNRIPF